MGLLSTGSIFLCTILMSISPTQKTFISSHNPLIRYTGRVDFSRPGKVCFDWPGIFLETSFEGTSCDMRMKGAGESFDVFLDGENVKVLKTDSLEKTYELFSGLKDTVHSLRVAKRYEVEGKIPEFEGLLIDNGKKLCPLLSPPRYRIEFIGASGLNGFGNEAKSIYCEDVRDSSDSYYSFGPVAARELGAEYFVLAVTGKGMVRNWGSPFITSQNAFPVYYSRKIRSMPESVWHPHKWIPHVVVISLGTNDFSTRPYPPRALFIYTYRSFLQTVYQNYPGVDIVCLTSDKEPVRTVVKEMVAQEVASGNSRIHFLSYKPIPFRERGCDWHPNVVAHRKIAGMLVNLIRPILEQK